MANVQEQLYQSKVNRLKEMEKQGDNQLQALYLQFWAHDIPEFAFIFNSKKPRKFFICPV
jgi:hypothetical protein